MVALHTGVLASAALEVVVLRRPFVAAVGVPALALVVLANLLRWWVIATLGPHWNVRVMGSLSIGVVSTGPFRFVRHPNYVAVFVELAALPLVHGAWLTALVGSALHALILRRRIALEEKVLFADAGYRAVMGPKPRFIPLPWRPTQTS
jgi:methyltransferase